MPEYPQAHCSGAGLDFDRVWRASNSRLTHFQTKTYFFFAWIGLVGNSSDWFELKEGLLVRLPAEIGKLRQPRVKVSLNR